MAAPSAISSDALAALDVSQAEEPEQTKIPVNSYNEWDPLEEVIVGRLEGATFPSSHITVTSNLPSLTAKVYRLTSANKIKALPGLAWSGGALADSLPAQSVTLYVLSK